MYKDKNNKETNSAKEEPIAAPTATSPFSKNQYIVKQNIGKNRTTEFKVSVLVLVVEKYKKKRHGTKEKKNQTHASLYNCP